ncbi:MAG TPA: hypothetical protein VFV72_14155 [Candidatus Limnocylindrales bacterium]|nr:hypothetical protein [Candidatus Limnocylindrales bacterium]
MRLPKLRLRHLLWIPALAVAIYANEVAKEHGLGLGPVLLFGIAPHVPAWLKMRPAISRLAHQPVLPVALIGLGAAGILSAFWLVGGMAWISHIIGDRAVGFGWPARPAQSARANAAPTAAQPDWGRA